MPPEKIYSKLPVIYNFVMNKVRYDRWSEYLQILVSFYIKDDADILELAGGNGSFAAYFLEYFPKLILTDKSFCMLASSNLKYTPKVCCDMLKLPFKSKFDLVYSTFDSINYLTNKKSLLNLFRQVKSALKDDGIFTFDVSLERNSLLHIEKPIRKGSHKGIYFIHNSIYNQRSRIHKNIFKIKINDEVFTEVHRQKIYPFELYFDIIDSAGLYVVECLETFSFIRAHSNSERAQFIVKKRANAKH